MNTSTKQANFLLPEDLLEELRKTVPGRQQSKLVAEVLRRELRRIKLKKAIQESFGAWKDKDHPELKKGTESLVRSLRRSTRMTRSR